MTYSRILPLISGIVFLFACSPQLALDRVGSKRPALHDKQTRADLAAQQNWEMTRDPESGLVPRDRLWKATEELKKWQRGQKKAAIANIQWIERGPNNIGGRTRAILFDPNDTNHARVFAGSVAGGLWVCEDIWAGTPSWSSVDEFLENLAITSLACDPTDTDTMYMGTGEGFYNGDAVRGDGIFRSVDGGASWTQLPSSTGFTYVNKVVVDNNGDVFAAVRGTGIVKSTDAGANWSTVLNTSTSSSNLAADIEISANGDLYAAMGLLSQNDGVYKSTNGGTSWTQVFTSTSTEGRVEIACAPSDSDVVYLVVEDYSSGDASRVLRSANGGSSWSTLSNPNDTTGSNFCRGQAWYDISLVVDPNDANHVYMGGIDLYRTADGGSSWRIVSHWYGNYFPYVHADQHIALFCPGSSDSILFGNDGGVFRTTDGNQASPSFDHVVSGYNVTQFYSGAIHPDAYSNYMIAGAQDNGSLRLNAAGLNRAIEVSGGDGAFCHIDDSNSNYQFTSYVYSYLYRSTDGGQNFSQITTSSSGRFINPTDYDPDQEILYGASSAGTFWRLRTAHTGTSLQSRSGSWTGTISAITVDPNTTDRILIGTGNGELYIVDGAGGNPPSTYTNIRSGSMPSGYVSSIAVEHGDANHLLVTFSNYGVTSVWESTNAGSSWINVEGNLPDIPIRWAIFSPIGGDSALLATELGVWSTDNLNGGNTNWEASNLGLANVRTDMLQFRASDSTIMVSTHGRGVFTYSFSTQVHVDFDAEETVVYPCASVQFRDGSANASSWEWDLDGDGFIDDTTQNPSFIYHEGGDYDIRLIVNGTDTLTRAAYIRVLPRLGTPYTVSDGGDFESNPWHFGSSATTGPDIWERGAPSNQLTTLNSSSNGWKTDLDADVPQYDIACHLYSPSFNMSASGTYTLGFYKSMEQFYSNAPYAVIVEYSTDGGQFWNKLGTSPDGNGTNWYANTGISTLVEGDGIGFLENATNENTQYNVSALAGNDDVRFRFTFKAFGGFSAAGFVDGFMLDDFTLSGPSNDPKEWEVETELNASATAYLGPNDTALYISNNCQILAQLINLSSHDFGLTTVKVQTAGTGAFDFDTNTIVAHQLFDKTLLITPTNSSSTANVKITTYHSSAEASGWKSATGSYFSQVSHIKTPGAVDTSTVASSTIGASPDVDSVFGNNALELTSAFSNGFSGVAVGHTSAGNPVPIHLLEFSGERQATACQLFWTTALEVNASHFELERSSGGDFVQIAEIRTQGSPWQLTDYSFLDQDAVVQLPTDLYYRLKMVDVDGSFSYGPILVLPIQKQRLVNLSPNPSDGEFQLQSSEALHGNMIVEVYGVDGRLVYFGQELQAGATLDLSFLAPGTYLARFRIGRTQLETQRILIQ